MEIFYKILAIIFSVAILGNVYIIKRIIGTWLFPGCLFSIFWFAYTFFPLVILFEVPINPLGTGFITICVILFSWTSVYIDWEKGFKLNANKPPAKELYDTRLLKRVLTFAILFSIYCTIKQVMAQGITFSEIIFEPLRTSGKYAGKRYSLALNNTIYYVFSLVFAYISTLVGGLVMGSTQSKKIKRLCLLSLLPSIFIMFTQGAKGLLFLTLFFFLGSLLVTKFHNKDFKLFNYKNNIKILKLMLLMFVILIFSFKSRGMQNISDLTVLISKLRRSFSSYMFTHLYGFSDWFSAYLGQKSSIDYDVSNNYFGFYTFNFFTKYFVSKDNLIRGTYGEYFKYQDFMQSNIYTFFRGLIMDFGVLGAIIFIVINGILLHIFFYIFLKNKKPIFSTAILVFSIGYFYMSFLISLLTWNIIIFAFILFILILTINKYKLVISKNDNI